MNVIQLGCKFAAGFRLAVALTALAVQSSPLQSQTPAATTPAPQTAEDITKSDPAEAAKLQSRLITGVRQLTFEGKRAGESYFSQDGRWMVFQSERETDNPFFQIYLMDRETGDTRRVSPGIGKTTCAWIHLDNQRVLFASTQFDPQARAKQQAEIDFRKSGQSRRYAWDYDETYDLVVCDLKSGDYVRLTDAIGYDAEASYSPDGKSICFASNRRAYSGELSAKEQELFAQDPASAIDLYMMDSDGSHVRRLTDTPGYDGGPFFSPDGQTICWRRFSENGATAEIMLMNVDGTNQRAITHMQAMSWAPYFHSSGDYLIFATNKHGFENFELYLVDAAGAHQPVRATYRTGFDGLPVFPPGGSSLVWTSNNGSSQSQLFEAKWNDVAARELLGLDGRSKPSAKADTAAAASSDSVAAAEALAAEVLAVSAAAVRPADIGRHVDYLCRPELGGRLTGTPGERKATAYVAAYLESLGLEPAGENGTFFQEFEFVSNVTLGPHNSLAAGDSQYEVNKDWRPLFFSEDGPIEPTDVVFAGYGIVAPAEKGQAEYNSYTHLDVKDKWVLVYRFLPQDITPERRQHLSAYSVLRYKAMVARDRGAKGMIVVSGPTSAVRQQLVPLSMDGTLGTTSLSVVSVTDDVARAWLKSSGKDLGQLQKELDTGEPMMGFALEGVKLSGTIDIEPVSSRGRNVLALLPAPLASEVDKSDPHYQKPALVVIGAHIDHLGTGAEGSSLAKEDEIGGIHRGADDNASGVAGMLEVAQYLKDEVAAGRLKPVRDTLLAAWSGEELGLRGSQAFCDRFAELYPDRAVWLMPLNKPTAKAEGDAAERDAAEERTASQGPITKLSPAIAACLNMDMIGRLRDQLVLQGIGSSPYWTGAIERRNAVIGLSLVLQADCNLPTDASTFFRRGVPILSAFTGSHNEYHTPRDTPELLNYEGAAETARLMALIARDVLTAAEPLPFTDQPIQKTAVASLRAYLGTIPNYTKEVKGAALDGVSKGGPAEQAGLKAGDVITELAGRRIENIYDYTFAIDALKIGEEVKVVVQRDGKTIELKVTPRSRQ